ncbi:hypothetical protein ISN45_Aa08g006510 [Arabidopsis thaliana x Arabidopsis arenosa]|uniref:Uncharacterized protein n=1 Tax=Arabidopsis thaliana x Arabidopsis arenosa TaxID=1240361 RepID=A0A8T1XL37_9BRAS|nr:hypothetical protein ISN45_Aa08g006510 [Arabidopsis thaliana x Arabidopsis arenosa]
MREDIPTKPGKLPANIWKAPNLQIFSASFSNLIGEIPNYVGCKSFYRIELQGNSLNGTIPWDIGHCEKLLCLNLSQNHLSGIIPWEISTLPSIADVDLSHNLLTGNIPSDFGSSKTITTFIVSYNQLIGPVPSGSLAHLNPSFFASNEGLCGDVVGKPCNSDRFNTGDADLDGHHNEERPKKTAGAIVWILAAAIGVGFFVLVAATRCFQKSYGNRVDGGGRNGGDIGPWKLTAFQRLNFTADDVVECLSKTDNILGMGSTGTVYKAEMPWVKFNCNRPFMATTAENAGPNPIEAEPIQIPSGDEAEAVRQSGSNRKKRKKDDDGDIEEDREAVSGDDCEVVADEDCDEVCYAGERVENNEEVVEEGQLAMECVPQEKEGGGVEATEKEGGGVEGQKLQGLRDKDYKGGGHGLNVQTSLFRFFGLFFVVYSD